jgi:hypothetical protein
MYTLKWLIEKSGQVQRGTRDGKYVPARPVVHFFLSRLRDAWEVLRGRADAFTWPDGQ